MNCFNLCRDAKNTLNVRLCYLAFLICSAIYCVILISFNLYTWFTIIIISANACSIITTFIHIWYLIHTNRGEITDTEFYICTWEIIPIGTILFGVIFYIVNVTTKVEAEFALMIAYAIILGCGIIIPLICTVMGVVCCCILSTYDNVKNREPQYDSTV